MKPKKHTFKLQVGGKTKAIVDLTPKPKKPIRAWGILNKDGKFNPYWIFASKKDLEEFIEDSSCKIIPIYISFTKPE